MGALNNFQQWRWLAVIVAVIAILQTVMISTKGAANRLPHAGEPEVDIFSLPVEAAAGDTSPSGLAMHVLALGDAEAILLQCGEEAVLVGTGAPWTHRSVVRYITDAVKGNLAATILLHGAVEHVGGLAAILRVVGSDHLYDATPVPADWLNDPAVSRALRQTPYQRWESGDRIRLQCAEIRVLAPISDSLATEAVASPLTATGGVLLVASGPAQALIAGQLDAAGETSLLRLYPELKADVLVVARKGHKSASSRLFLERLQPRTAVIPVGVYNEEGRPHDEVLARLQAVGAKIYRTDLDGTVIFRFRPHEVEVNRQRGRWQGERRRDANTAHQR